VGRSVHRLVCASIAQSGDDSVRGTVSFSERGSAQRSFPLRISIALTHVVAIVALASRVSAASAPVSGAPDTQSNSVAGIEQNKHCDDSASANDQSNSDTKAAAKPSRSDANAGSDGDDHKGSADKPAASTDAENDSSSRADGDDSGDADAGADSADNQKSSDCSDDKNDDSDDEATEVDPDERPTLTSKFDYYTDSQHYVNLTSTSIATAPFHGFMISLQRDWVQASAPSLLQAAEVTTLAFSKDLSEQFGIGGGFGTARAMQSTDMVGSLAANFNYRGATFTTTIAREMLMDSARTMAANIRQTDFGLSFSDDLSEQIAANAEAHHHVFTDGNSSNDFALTPKYVFDLAGSKLEVGYRFSYTAFAHSAPSGYWTPQSALSNGIYSALTFDRTWIYGHSELGLDYDSVRERGPLSNGPSSGPGASATFALGIRPLRDTELETYWTGTGSAGWNSMNFGLSLKYFF
jgi:hypothetical protein